MHQAAQIGQPALTPQVASGLALLLWLTLGAGCGAKQKQHMQLPDDDNRGASGLPGAFEALPEDAPFAELAILDSPTRAWVERWRLLESAHRSIECVTFILSPDVFGLAFLGKLHQRALEGVRVRLLLDSRGAIKFTAGMGHQEELQTLAAENADVRLYNALSSGMRKMVETFDIVPVVASNHDKILLVDRHTGIIGGRNVAREYFTEIEDDKEAMIDLDVSISGHEVAGEMLKAFDREFGVEGLVRVRGAVTSSADENMAVAMGLMDLWLHEPPLSRADIDDLHSNRNRQDQLQLTLEQEFSATGAHVRHGLVRELSSELVRAFHLRGALGAVPPQVVRARTRILASSSTEGTGLNQINATLAHLAQAARHEIVIENPYVILTKEGLKVLKEADGRGVKITILTNSAASSDSLLSQALFNSRWPRMMAALPRLKIFVMGEAHAYHGKAGVFDNTVSVVGSYNLDPLSFGVDSEIVAVVWSREFASRIAALAHREIRRGEPHVYAYSIRLNSDGTPMRVPAGQLNAGAVLEDQGPSSHCDKGLLLKLQAAEVALEALRDHSLLQPLM